jgi:hypothetical protein
LFGNIIHLKINKRLINEEDRQEFYKLIEIFKNTDNDAIDKWIHKNCNIISKNDLLSIRSNVKVAITATNYQRTHFNNFFYPVVYGKDDWFSVGHVIMFDKPSIRSFGYKFGKSQLFKIIEKDCDAFVLENVYTQDIVIIDDEDWLRKNFNYPFATTCHSWQGDTCKENVLIVGWNKNWVDFNWKFSILTRPDYFKKAYILIDENLSLHQKNSDDRLIEKLNSLIEQDIQRFGRDAINFSRMIDLQWMKNKLHDALMENKSCHGCDGDLNSWDRIDSSLPHYKSNTQLVCWECNRSKQDRW